MLKRWSTVHVKPSVGKIVNPIYEFNAEGSTKKIIGYRITDGRRPAFWYVVPSYMIEEAEDA